MAAVHFTLRGAGDIGYAEVMASRRIHNTYLMVNDYPLSYSASEINPTLQARIADAAGIVAELSGEVKTDDIKNEVQILAYDLRAIATTVEARLNTPFGQVHWLAVGNMTDEDLRASISELRVKAAALEMAGEI